MTDRELLGAYTAVESEEAFTEIVRRYTNTVYSACLHSLRNAGAAEDATQATFLVLARKARSISPDAALGGWLYRTARNCALTMKRSLARIHKREMEAAAMSEQTTQATEITGDLLELLNSAISRLPQRQRAVLVLRYLQGKSQVETAAEMRCPEHTISATLSRAIAGLRKTLTPSGASFSTAGLVGILSSNYVQEAPVHLAESVKAVCTGKVAASGMVSSVSSSVAGQGTWLMLKIAAAVGVAGVLVWGALSLGPRSVPDSSPRHVNIAPGTDKIAGHAVVTWSGPVVLALNEDAERKITGIEKSRMDVVLLDGRKGKSLGVVACSNVVNNSAGDSGVLSTFSGKADVGGKAVSALIEAKFDLRAMHWKFDLNTLILENEDGGRQELVSSNRTFKIDSKGFRDESGKPVMFSNVKATD